jgi:hypothetical protein
VNFFFERRKNLELYILNFFSTIGIRAGRSGIVLGGAILSREEFSTLQVC